MANAEKLRQLLDEKKEPEVRRKLSLIIEAVPKLITVALDRRLVSFGKVSFLKFSDIFYCRT